MSARVRAEAVDNIGQTPTQPRDYATLNATWAALAVAVLVFSDEDAPPVQELPVFGLAAFAMTKAVAKEKVGVWMRDPLVHETTEGRPPKGERLRYAAGELLTCTRCLGTWTSLGLVGLRVLRPREGRIIATVLASAGINDWLQAGFNTATSRANANAKLADAPLDEWPAAPAAATTAG